MDRERMATFYRFAFGWQTEDWMGGLKTGLAQAENDDLDEFENAVKLDRKWDEQAELTRPSLNAGKK